MLWHFIGKGLLCLAALYLCYALIGSTAPWLPFSQPATAVDTADYFGEGQGPDRAALIETPNDALGVRTRLVREATHTLDVVYYSIQPDGSGEAFLGEVLAAADRGVRVRILVDGKVGGGETKRWLAALAAHESITCYRYNPLNPLAPWRWHAVLHDKIILVDGRYALVGGRNIGDRFFDPAGYAEPVTHDRDVLVFTDGDGGGSVLPEIAAYVDTLMASRANAAIAPARDAAARQDALRGAATAYAEANADALSRTLDDYRQAALPTRKITLATNPIHTRRKEPRIAREITALAQGGEAAVRIQTPYATASRLLLDTLAAIDADADTTLLTNSLASSPNYFAFSNYYSQRDRFLRTGVDIFELQSADSIHAKSMTIDGRVGIVGSLNMDDRSFYIDTEIVLIIDSEPFAAALDGAMDAYQACSLMVDPASNAYIPGSGPDALPVGRAKRMGMAAASLLTRIFYFLM